LPACLDVSRQESRVFYFGKYRKKITLRLSGKYRAKSLRDSGFGIQNSGFKIAGVLLFVCFFAFTACEIGQGNFVELSMREVTDDLGRKIKIPSKVDRVVSLAPNLTENIFAVGAGDRLVGVTTFCNYPAEAEKIRKIGDTMAPNMEAIIALKPQIVFVSTASQIESFTKTLERQNINVFVTNPVDLEGVYRNLYQLGEIFGTEDETRGKIDEMRRRVADVEARTATAPDVKVFVQISKEPLFTVGRESFLTEIINRAGGVSVTADVATAYPRFSKETALALQPEAIILSESEDNPEPNEVFKDSPAVKNKRVFKINADLLSRPGPRIVDALERMAKDLHPENFR
jgi:iron complex transport system substrate-binding protein